MIVRFEYYGVLTERGRNAPREVEIEGAAPTVEAILDRLAGAAPEIRDDLRRCIVALGDEVLRKDETVPGDATLALLPPSCGG